MLRKDKSNFTQNTYIKIKNKCTFDEARNILLSEVQNLRNGQIPRHDLIINKTMASNYKTDTFYLKIFADKIGNIKPGDTVSYVIVQVEGILGDRMRLPHTNEEIDYNYYINELMGCVMKLFLMGFENKESMLITCI